METYLIINTMPRTKKMKPTLEGDAENEKAKFKKVAEKLIELKPILMNYTIKAVIPTGPFGNIQPEITVFAHTLEAAEQFVLPHVDKLFVKYFNAYLNGIPETKSMQKQPESMQKPVNLNPTTNTGPTPAPMKTNACITAEQAIAGCTSLEALTLVKSRIKNSVKLTAEEKVFLAFALNTKNDELYAQTKNEENKTDTK